MRPVRNVFQKLSRTEQRREGVFAYLCLRRKPWTELRTPVSSYPIDVFHLSFNFLCLVLFQCIYLNGPIPYTMFFFGFGLRGSICVGNLSPAMGTRNQVGIGCRTGPPTYVAWLRNSRLGSWNRFLAPQRDLSFRLCFVLLACTLALTGSD